MELPRQIGVGKYELKMKLAVVDKCDTGSYTPGNRHWVYKLLLAIGHAAENRKAHICEDHKNTEEETGGTGENVR